MTQISPRPNTPAQLVVFTDLDGTLLDHHSYSYAAAEPALAQLRARKVPLVLASSKTATEIAALRAELGFAHCPAIVENGAGLLEGGAEPGDDRAEHQRLLAALNNLPTSLRAGFEGFTDWGVEGVAAHTGLSPEAAARAAERGFSEPGLWTSDADGLKAFLTALANVGIAARQGGRYLTLSYGGTKAGQMQKALAELGAKNARVIALGDAPNDLEMLLSADHGYILPNDTGAGIPHLSQEDTGQITRAHYAGPEGWNIAVLAELARL